MNPWQLAQQIKHALTTAVWPTGAGELVFGLDRVRLFTGSPTKDQIPTGFPWCLIGIGSGDPDGDHPEFIVQTFDVVAGVSVFGDPMGEFAIMGGPSGDLGASDSRGIAEIAARTRAAVADLTGADGAKILLTATRIDAQQAFDTNRHLVADSHTLTGLCTSDLHYAAPQQLVLTNATDLWDWEGAHCSDRFDFKQYRMYWTTGTTPASRPDDPDATLVYTGDDPTTVHTAVSGRTYTVFCDYSSRKQTGVIEGSSAPEVGSFKAI